MIKTKSRFLSYVQQVNLVNQLTLVSQIYSTGVYHNRIKRIILYKVAAQNFEVFSNIQN
jgi:hypothetical protein